MTLLSEKSLGVATERVIHTDEEPQIAVTTRNIDKLEISLHPLNLESYFRKTHELGRVDHLDIDLIQTLSPLSVTGGTLQQQQTDQDIGFSITCSK